MQSFLTEKVIKAQISYLTQDHGQMLVQSPEQSWPTSGDTTLPKVTTLSYAVLAKTQLFPLCSEPRADVISTRMIFWFLDFKKNIFLFYSDSMYIFQLCYPSKSLRFINCLSSLFSWEEFSATLSLTLYLRFPSPLHNAWL